MGLCVVVQIRNSGLRKIGNLEYWLVNYFDRYLFMFLHHQHFQSIILMPLFDYKGTLFCTRLFIIEVKVTLLVMSAEYYLRISIDLFRKKLWFI